MAYTTTAALRTYLGVTTGTDDDALLAELIARAQDHIDRHCGQSFEAAADTTRYFAAISAEEGGPIDGRDLILDAPLCAITSVTNGNGTVVSAANYVTLPPNTTRWYAIRLKSSSGLLWTYNTDVETDLIAVVGRWAFSITAPATIVQACTRLAAYLYRQRANSSDLDRAVAVGNNAMLLPSDLPRDLQLLLVNFRRLV